MENHPDLYRLAENYEKIDPANGTRYTWVARESLAELRTPERIAQIKAEHQARMNDPRRFRTNLTLHEAIAEDDEDDEDGERPCMICDL